LIVAVAAVPSGLTYTVSESPAATPVLEYASTTERPNVPPVTPTVPAVVVTVTDSFPATVPELPEAFLNLT